MKVLDLFSGIGGFSLAAHWMGWETVAFVEKDAFCQKVLRKNFGQDIEIYDDITTCSGKPFRGRIDIVTGGFPCQDISGAGKRGGISGKRSGLWSEFYRVIGEVRPRYAVVENVSALLGRGMDVVLRDLSEIGYDTEWRTFSACEMGFPHTRERVFIVAYPERQPGTRFVFDRYCQEATGRNQVSQKRRQDWFGFEIPPVADSVVSRWSMQLRQPGLVRTDDGIPNIVDRVKSLGNSIVPQIAFEIFKAIEATDKR